MSDEEEMECPTPCARCNKWCEQTEMLSGREVGNNIWELLCPKCYEEYEDE